MRVRQRKGEAEDWQKSTQVIEDSSFLFCIGVDNVCILIVSECDERSGTPPLFDDVGFTMPNVEDHIPEIDSEDPMGEVGKLEIPLSGNMFDSSKCYYLLSLQL